MTSLPAAQVADPTLTIAPEWAPQRAIWTAWPANAAEWNGDLAAPRQDIAALIHALHAAGNRVRLLVCGPEAAVSARSAVGRAADLVAADYGDIWLRDTGPVFARTRTTAGDPAPVALRFATNSWGGKFDLPADATVGDAIARHAQTPVRRHPFVLEGGAIDHDGTGTILTTRQTLLNPNRNGWSKPEAEAALRCALGARSVTSLSLPNAAAIRRQVRKYWSNVRI